jgi:hypothetical protein
MFFNSSYRYIRHTWKSHCHFTSRCAATVVFLERSMYVKRNKSCLNLWKWLKCNNFDTMILLFGWISFIIYFGSLCISFSLSLSLSLSEKFNAKIELNPCLQEVLKYSNICVISVRLLLLTLFVQVFRFSHTFQISWN